MIGVLAWFYIYMNLIHTIVRTHYSTSLGKNGNEHIIQEDVTAWGRTQFTRDNPQYHVLAPLLAQSFSAQVLALFYHALDGNSKLANLAEVDREKSEGFDRIIESLNLEEFLALVDKVMQVAFTRDAWDGKGHSDSTFTTMCRFLQEVEL